MPRKLRQVEPGAVYHFIARFVANEWLIPTDVERRQYLHLLGRGLRGSDWKCISYGIMSSHVHLGILAGQQPMTRWLRGAHGIFADWINIRRARIGAVFVRGPKLLKVKTFGVNDLVAYIHNNPVRAGVVASPDATDWTSYRAYSRGIRLPWLDVETGVRLARMPDAQSVAAHALVSRASRADFEIPRRNARGPGEHGEHDEYDEFDEFDEFDEYLGDEDEGEDEDDAGAPSTVDSVSSASG